MKDLYLLFLFPYSTIRYLYIVLYLKMLRLLLEIQNAGPCIIYSPEVSKKSSRIYFA